MSSPQLNDTSAAILAFLSSAPRSGWDVATGLHALVGDFWNVTTSQVYRELASNTDRGYVSPGAEGARSRRPYSITDAGRAALDEWLDSPPAPDIVRIPLLLKMFLTFRLRPHDTSSLTSFVDAYREERAARLASYEAKIGDLEGTPFAQLLRYGLNHERAVLEWVDSLREPKRRRQKDR